MAAHPLDDEAVFNIARKIESPAVRAEYVQQACGDDSQLSARVERLLSIHEKDRDFLQGPAIGEAATVDVPDLYERPGMVIGRYKLLQRIGEGGFGVVFMAEQETPVRRTVAFKIVKPGMDSRQVIARFEAERQALAIMNHPNIAHVFDGGVTESGRPYFVMELVKGVPITEYCDKNDLPITERLRLLTHVCNAVQHAHQKGVIHRDLKPSNIMVTLHDGKPVVKVIDFGVSKALNQRLTEKTLFTAYGQMIGTPQYMSPEQAEMSGLDVDTRSDVYSLGVLLFELLTGTTPLEAEQLRTAGYVEMQRLIREEEAPKPSTRLSTSGGMLTIVAKHRSVSPEKLKHQVQGDLDWIVMKALEKDRKRRFETAKDLAADIERHLAHRPVIACPPSLTYRLRKFVRRHRVALTATLLMTASTGIGLSVAAWKTYESVQNLRAYHDLTFKRTMNAAVLGDKELLRDLVKAENAGIPEDWQSFLKGMVHFYDGQMQEASDDFEESLRIDKENMAACALLATCCAWQGKWDRAALYKTRLDSMSPREGYEEYDRIFNSLFDIYREASRDRSSFEKYLKRYPNSALVRLFLVLACAQPALADGDLELARMNVDRNVVVVEELLPDSVLAQVVSLFSYAAYMQLAKTDGESTEHVRNRADIVAERMQSEDFGLVHYTRGMYLEAVGKQDEALASWERAAKASTAADIYIPEAVRLGRTAAVADFLMKAPQAQENSEFIEVERRIRNGEARDTIEKLPDSTGLAVVLYVGNQETIPKSVVEMEPGNHLYVELRIRAANPHGTRQFLEGTLTEDQLIANAGRSRLELAKAYYLIGLDHLAKGRTTAGAEALAKVVDQGQINWPIHYIARLLCERAGDQRPQLRR